MDFTQASPRYYQQLLQSLNGHIMFVDRSFIIRYINRVAPGFHAEGVIGQSVFHFLPPECQTSVRASYEHVLSTGEEVEFDVYAGVGEQPMLWYRVYASPWAENGEIKALVLLTHEVSAAKPEVGQIDQHKQAVSSSDRIFTTTHTASYIAHEINQPLSAMVNYSRGLEHQLDRDTLSLEDLRATLSKLTQLAVYASDIVSRVRESINSAPSVKQPIGLLSVIKQALQLSYLTIPILPQQIHLLCSEVEVPVMGSTTQLQQVILNVLANAAEACSTRRNLHVTITLQTSERNATLVIKDNGGGMTPEQQKRVFDSFYSTKNGNLGLGLAICHSIVVDHAGSIQCESQIGDGSAIIITLPLLQ